MASSLSIAQDIALFEALEVPYLTSFYTLDEIGSLTAQTTIGGTAAQAFTSIQTHLDTLSSSNGETQLIAMLDRWIAIGTKVANIDGGAVGGLQGVSMSYDDERNLLRERIKIIVPYYKFHEVLEKRASMGSSGGMSIAIMR